MGMVRFHDWSKLSSGLTDVSKLHFYCYGIKGCVHT